MDLHRGDLHADRRFHLDVAVIGALLLALLFALPAQAQISVEVSPLRLELQGNPGGTTTQAITINNAGKEPVRVRARVSNWELSKDGAPQFEGAAESSPYYASEWTRIAPPELVVEPGKPGTVRFSMTVPADAQPAGYRTSVLFEFGPASGDPVARGREVQFKSRIATLIYVTVGQPAAAVELTDLRVRTAAEQMQVIATLKNTGKRTVRTKGSLLIYDKSGTAVREVPVPDVPVLPESERDVTIVAFEVAKSPLLPGEYRVEVKIDAGMPALIVGETTMKVGK